MLCKRKNMKVFNILLVLFLIFIVMPLPSILSAMGPMGLEVAEPLVVGLLVNYPDSIL